MRRRWAATGLFLLATGFCGAAGSERPKEAAFAGGLYLQLGFRDEEDLLELAKRCRGLVYGLHRERQAVEKLLRRAFERDLLETLFADVFSGEGLPLVSGLADYICMEEAYDVAPEELFRVLAPGGVVSLPKEKKRWDEERMTNAGFRRADGEVGGVWLKPWPQEIDEWTHYLHGPGNNAVAQDEKVGCPRHAQWHAGPQWTRTHHHLNSVSSMVTSRGRLFYILDQSTPADLSVPGSWAVVARNAFNGIKLWERGMDSWTWHKIRFRSGPPQVARLLVAAEDRLYVPLGLDQPVACLDAATGETAFTFRETEGAEEILAVKDRLLVLKGEPVAEHAVGHPSFSDRYKAPNTKSVMALNRNNGELLWTWDQEEGVVPLPETLASDGERVFFQFREGVLCLDLASGETLWTFGERSPKNGGHRGHGKYTLVVSDGVVLFDLQGRLTALSAVDGGKLWDCEAGGGFHAPLDLFVIDGLVWQGCHTSDSVAPPAVRDFNEGRDLRTGRIEAVNQVAVDLQTSGHHHRCYREKATIRYILMGKRGIELMDLRGDRHSRNNWVRGTCQYGILPANGLLYVPPHSCGCYMESKLRGFWALSSPEEGRFGPNPPGRLGEERLVKGSACSDLERMPAPKEEGGDWTQYRHDALRSGVAGTLLPEKLRRNWCVSLGGGLTQPVVSNGVVAVASTDRRSIYALDLESGKIRWQRAAGGRVDSPPTLRGDRLLFGAADGSVTCLRLRDGELVWRFRAAPTETKLVSRGQLESVWPVHGTVLLLDDVAYAAAGRSTWLDGGIDLFGLDPDSGEVLYRHHYETRHPEYGSGQEMARDEHETRIDQNTTDYKTFLQSDRSDSFSMGAGSVADVLVSDGRHVYMHHVKFTPKLSRLEERGRHLFSTSSLLDGAENHRSHWLLGTGDFSRVPVAYSWIVNSWGRKGVGAAVPVGLMMVFEEDAAWVVEKRGGYRLVERENTRFSEEEKPLPDIRELGEKGGVPIRWEKPLKARPRAMIKCGDLLVLGTEPEGAFRGEEKGEIWVVSAKDGESKGRYPLPSPAVWDGMAAASGSLLCSTRDGVLICLGD